MDFYRPDSPLEVRASVPCQWQVLPIITRRRPMNKGITRGSSVLGATSHQLSLKRKGATVINRNPLNLPAGGTGFAPVTSIMRV